LRFWDKPGRKTAALVLIGLLLISVFASGMYVMINRNAALTAYSEALESRLEEAGDPDIKLAEASAAVQEQTLKAGELESQLAESERRRSELEASLAEASEKLLQAQELAYLQVDYLLRDIHVTLIDDRITDQELIGMLKRHFKALYEADGEAYKKTLADPGSDYMLGHLGNEKLDSSLSLLMALKDQRPLDLSVGGFYLIAEVWVYKGEEPFKRSYTVGVTKQSGEWLVYDYD
jgi:hypothetical protein